MIPLLGTAAEVATIDIYVTAAGVLLTVTGRTSAPWKE